MTECRGASGRPLVAIYREMLMNYNEVYLRTEVEALQRYRSVYVGSHRVREVELPEDRTVTLRERYHGVDRVLDPLVTRIGRRVGYFAHLAPVARALAPGSVVGRASEYLFQVHGLSPTLVRTLRALKPDILHAYTGVSGAHALPLARRLRIPLVVSFGGYDATATEAELRQWATRGRVLLRRKEAMKREMQRIVTISDFLRRQLVERGWPAEKIRVIHRGIDTERFTPEGSPPLSERAPVVFFAGRLIEVKGTTYLLRAMREVRTRVPDARLVIAGAGELRAALEREAGELGVPVRFLGRASADVVRACHAEAQVYCMPSVTAATGQREGLSNALLEAMAAGLPVVGSDSGGIPEAIGDAGFLVAERDVGALASRITQLLSDAALRERMGRAARQRIATHFDLRRQAAKLEALYDEAITEYAEHAEHTAARRRQPM
jgi:glycosyltransferase involved in cell wall biosynthesis